MKHQEDYSIFMMCFSKQCGSCEYFIGKDNTLSNAEGRVARFGVKYNSEFIRNVLKCGQPTQKLEGIAIVFKDFSPVRENIIAFTVFNLLNDEAVISHKHELTPGDIYFVTNLINDKDEKTRVIPTKMGGRAEFFRKLNEYIPNIDFKGHVGGFPSFLLFDCENWSHALKHKTPAVGVNVYRKIYLIGGEVPSIGEQVHHKDLYSAVKSYIEFSD